MFPQLLLGWHKHSSTNAHSSLTDGQTGIAGQVQSHLGDVLPNTCCRDAQEVGASSPSTDIFYPDHLNIRVTTVDDIDTERFQVRKFRSASALV